jgi:hypothetical protein
MPVNPTEDGCAPPRRQAGATARRRAAALLAFLCAFSAPSAVNAQVKASEPATISQTVDGTKFIIEYSRPRTRGRDTIFGKIVPWGEVWTPGANAATTLEVDKDVTIEGRPLRKGKYSLWMQVQPGDWTMVIDTNPKLFHTQHPKEDSTQVRWTLSPGTGPFTEVLTWEFDQVRLDGATMVMRWGTVRVPLEVRVQPSYTLAFDGAKAGPYLGSWVIQSEAGMGPDTTPVRVEIAHRDGRLVGTLDPPMFDTEEYRNMVLIPKRAGWFVPGWIYRGELYEIWDEVLFDFELKDGRATGFAVRGPKDQVFARGTRTD